MKFPIRRPKDTVPAMLRPREAVMVPEFTKMVGGSKGVNFLNRAAEAKARMPTQHFQKGGEVLPPDLAELARQSGVDPDLVKALYKQNQALGNERDFPRDMETAYQFRDKLAPQHFDVGGIAAPVLQGGPDSRIAPRGMPDVFARPTPPPDPTAGGQVLQGGPTPAPYPAGTGLGGVPPGGGFQTPTLRSPMPFKPNVDPRAYGGGYSSTDPVQYFEGGGVAGGNSMEPGDLDQNQWGMDFQGSYYPPDWMGPDNSPNNPQAPYIGYFGNGPDGQPTGSYMPEEYRNYWSHHGGDDGELNPTQRLDAIANSRMGQSGHWDRFRGWVPDGEGGGDINRGENSGDVSTSPSSGYLYGTGSNPSQMSPYDPSFPYGSPGASGSGVPTQRGFGLLGNVVGGALGSLIPGGTGLGAKLGGWGARALTRAFQNYGANKNPNAGGGSGAGGGGGGAQGYGAMEGGMFSGLPEGFTEARNPQGSYGAPNFYGPGGPGQGPQFTGDSIFGGRTNLSMALPGSFSGLGQGSAGDVSHNFFGNMSTKRLISGGDASLGMGANDAIPQFARFLSEHGGGFGGPQGVMLPPSQWGGTANQGTMGGQSSRMGSNQRQMSRE